MVFIQFNACAHSLTHSVLEVCCAQYLFRSLNCKYEMQSGLCDLASCHAIYVFVEHMQNDDRQKKKEKHTKKNYSMKKNYTYKAANEEKK